MFAILGWIVFGLIAGVIAKAIMPGRDPGGCIVTILIGIAGSLLGGFIGHYLLGYGTGGRGDVTRAARSVRTATSPRMSKERDQISRG